MSTGLYYAGMIQPEYLSSARCGITGVELGQDYAFSLVNRSAFTRGINNLFAYGPEGFDRLLRAIISSRLYGRIETGTRYIERVEITHDGRPVVSVLRFGEEKILVSAVQIKIFTYFYAGENMFCLACNARQKETFAACNPSITQVLCARCYWQAMAEIMFADDGEKFNSYPR